MQDNATCHTSKLTKSKFFDQKGFEPLKWPPQSPDLNPIENLWAIMKKLLWRRRDQIKNQRDTWKIALEIWNKLPDEEIIKKIYNSLPDRCFKIINIKRNNAY